MINLKKDYGEKYKVRREIANSRSLWDLIILCRYGHIFVYGEDKLGFASKERAGHLKRKLAQVPGVVFWMQGDTSFNCHFPASSFDAVAEIVKPRKRKVLTELQREAGTARLRAARALKNAGLAI